MLLLAASLFFTNPAPLDMPRAEAYVVTSQSGEMRLDDRYSRIDLWTSRAVLGRWEDDDGRLFMLARLDTVPPHFQTDDSLTRAKYTEEEVRIDPKKDVDIVAEALSRLSPVEIADKPLSPRQPIRGFREVLYYEGTNMSSIVCAFLVEKEEPRVWRLATWDLLPADDREWAREMFEKDFLGKWDEIVESDLPSELPASGSDVADLDAQEEKGDESSRDQRRHGSSKTAPDPALAERELLRCDAHHSITNYATWRFSDAPEFTVLYTTGVSQDFIAALTNDMSQMRRRYAEVMPSPIQGSNVLCVARIYSDRLDYLAAAKEDMAWSAAYWNQLRRELVAYLPASGDDGLMRTIRHEAFHQYFSYAASMISPSPWINEGYAQYFEDESSLNWALQRAIPSASSGNPSPEEINAIADMIPSVLAMDYDRFYAGDSSERNMKYRIAWSIAVFLEKGAPKLPFRPFEDVKRDYMAALLKTHDMHKATAAAFRSKERFESFILEWKKFWRNM